MKRLLIYLALLIAILFFSGCQLVPKTVEFFQDKVKPVPIKTEKAKEFERQAAKYLEEKINTAHEEAVRADVTNSVVEPLTDAKIVASPLSESLGPPITPWSSTSTNLALQIEKTLAKFNTQLEKYREIVKPNEGKAIEGTGLLQIPYFVWLTVVIGGFFFLYILIKSVLQALMISSGAGIPLSIGLKSISGIASKNIKQGFVQVVQGLERTKEFIKQSSQSTFTKEEVLELIRNEQMKSQNVEIQKIIKELTHN